MTGFNGPLNLALIIGRGMRLVQPSVIVITIIKSQGFKEKVLWQTFPIL